jgi:GNAT superfamily N-acetyltransferase
MRTCIKTFNLSKQLPPKDVLHFCHRNNFNARRKADDASEGGVIEHQLNTSLHLKKDFLIMAQSEKQWVGWAMVYSDSAYGRNIPHFQIYVPPRQRRKGIGTKLLRHACKLKGPVKVFDISTSHKFFMANGLTESETITGKKLKRS